MLHLTILNLQKTIFADNVQSITLPAAKGEITILPNHLPIITPLKKGVISVSISSEREREILAKKYFECSEGILEFSDNKATVLL